MHVPLIAGRVYNRSDNHGSAPVLIVNQQFVRTWFPGQNPIGQHVQIGAMMGPGFEDPVREIVGVVGDVKQTGLDAATPGIMYLSSGQIPDQMTKMTNGLYGVLSFAGARQTQEIGVRMAMGAQRSDIVRAVLRNASQLIFIGLGIGVLASLAAAHLLQSLVFGIAPRNPFALAAMSCLLLATGLFAAWWPARRAAATEPMQALRAE